MPADDNAHKELPMSNPLEGIRILDLTRLLPGAVCTLMLADLGADVIKVEAPGGGDYARTMTEPKIKALSVIFRATNRGKRSIILDLKTPGGPDVLKKLVASADVLIESFRPGVMAKLGCDFETLKTANPRLIYCALSGWGADGPYAQDPHHDLNYTALAGMTAAMQTPQPMGGQISDMGGAMSAFGAIMAALFRRERSGAPAFIDASLGEGGLPFALFNWVEAVSTPADTKPDTLTGGLACYRVYSARDGKPVALAALEEKFWRVFCEHIERPDLIEHHLDPQRQRYLITELTEIFAMRSAVDWQVELGRAGCCLTTATDIARIHEDPHFKYRRLLGLFDDGTPWMRSPVRIDASAPQVENDAPDYGQHTTEVLREVGYDDNEINTLLNSEIIKAL